RAVATHAGNWRLLEGAAQQYQNVPHYGAIVAGKFVRGDRRGNDGKRVNSFERDRSRSLQLMQQAAQRVVAEGDKAEASEFYFRFAETVSGARFGGAAWRLQYLTDLAKLPDYDETDPYGWGRIGFGRAGGGNNRGAPVDADGKPVYHAVPKGWDAAKTDGERWRWCLTMAVEALPSQASRSKYTLAAFCREQFDVQTMLGYGYGRRPFPVRPPGGVPGVPGQQGDDDTRKDEAGPYAVGSLGEDETIAKLATGIKRFKLPDEFNFIKISRELAADRNAPYAQHGAQLLATVFEDRQQLPKAAEFWKLCVDQNWSRDHAQHRLDQIVGNWGEFDAEETNPAGAEPTLGFLFRNGKKASFTAQQLDVEKLLADVKAYVKSQPNQLDYEQVQLHNIGYRVVEKNQQQYVVKEVAKWDVDLKPRDKHQDRRTYIKAPLKDAGAYLVTAKMEGGNTTRVVVWVADTAIVKKAIDGGTYVFVADANSGAPLAKANVSFFGYRFEWQGNGKRPKVITDEFAEFTDADGQIVLKNDRMRSDLQWVIQAQSGDRRAFYGFDSLWSGGGGYDAEYHMNKAFTVTDRPVYRPGQAVKFKTWVGQAKYDAEGKSVYADRTFTVRVTDPRGQKLLERGFTTDAYGGLEGELALGREATLGTYGINIINFPEIQQAGGNSFRVEEYKKPEFEVKVDAPTEPVMLGQKIAATIKANYYFGAPVSGGTVKYKVLRSSYSANWYPPGRWDWFYEPGYWWYGHDYLWYPGFREWGCFAPVPAWFGRGYQPPELVAENEVEVGPDGTMKVEIDTAPAKAVHGYTDHQYTITAEVTDESRRTIVGTGTVSVARKPFKVYAWVDRGFYNENDVVRADFAALTLDNKPVKGKGELKLLKVSYDAKRQPVEKEVGKWDVDPNAEGRTTHQLKAAEPGQYRLSYAVTDAAGNKIEGGYLFVVRGPGFDGKDYRFNDLELTADKAEYAAGEPVKLMVNTERANGTVLLFERASNGVATAPKVLRLDGKSTVRDLPVTKRDMPNFFVEAVTVANGKVFGQTKEIVVPPDNRVTNVEVKPSQTRYKPNEKATVTFKLTNPEGKPVVGSAVVSIYDKSVEYISGGSNTPDIRKFFWQWRRHHYPRTASSLAMASPPVHRSGETTLQL
ncbi:MAG TPA: MG2 domain-containing protein, partial [Humisphaera sp.]